MADSRLEKRAHAHATAIPTGYWEPARPAPYGNLEMGICEGRDNCDYWDHYYQQHNSHVVGMFVTWGIIAGLLVVTGVINFARRRKRTPDAAVSKDEEGMRRTGGNGRVLSTLSAYFRRRLQAQSLWGMFPRVTRLQATMALMLTLYCIAFTFIGLSYKTWVAPTQPPGRRIGFLEFGGDRTGCLAFAFIPLVFILSSRDNIFSLVTGISYQHFNFLHRWVGRFIFIMTWVHTILWSIELGIMYQPQPLKYKNTWKKRYWKWGVGATALLTFLFFHSFRRVQRWTGYEFFRKSHELIAVLFLGACWGHWPEMREWMISGIAIVFFDRTVRYGRMFAIHMNWTSSETGAFGLRTFTGAIERYHDTDGIDVLILRVTGTAVWKAGQHYFLTFPTLNFFESHPYTTSSIPTLGSSLQEQLYIIRTLKGQTKRLAALCTEPNEIYPLPTLVCGAYGTPVIDVNAAHYQLIAGGTGVSFTLPLAQHLIASRPATEKTVIDFVWIVRRTDNLRWIRAELLTLRKQAAAAPGVELSVKIFVTREAKDSSSGASAVSVSVDGAAEKEIAEIVIPSASSDDHDIRNHHPRCNDIVRGFRDACVGKIQVLASGPPGLGRDLREAVAGCNDAKKVWAGDEGGEVALYWDSREY